ncbi:MAG: hypothetical protein IJ590_00330 [Rickettsiales bacterium]|nr:hypothetical protein [Rickettsiales bacterium]
MRRAVNIVCKITFLACVVVLNCAFDILEDVVFNFSKTTDVLSHDDMLSVVKDVKGLSDVKSANVMDKTPEIPSGKSEKVMPDIGLNKKLNLDFTNSLTQQVSATPNVNYLTGQKTADEAAKEKAGSTNIDFIGTSTENFNMFLDAPKVPNLQKGPIVKPESMEIPGLDGVLPINLTAPFDSKVHDSSNLKIFNIVDISKSPSGILEDTLNSKVLDVLP